MNLLFMMTTGKNEGIAYDRLSVHLIPIIKNQQSKIEKLEELINE